MLSDEQREALANEIDPQIIPIEESREFVRVFTPMIEQWISEAVADALESGELPEGYERTREGNHSHDYELATLERVRITGPWREVEQS